MGNLVIGHVKERIIGGRSRHAVGGIHDALRLRVGCAEVGDNLVVADDHRHPNPGGVIRSAIVLHAVLEGILAVRYLPNLFPHPPLGVVHERGAGLVDDGHPVLIQELVQAALRDVQRPDHGVEVAPGMPWRAVVGQDDLPDVLHVFAAAHDLDQGQS